jgi:ankyrin repeat protein
MASRHESTDWLSDDDRPRLFEDFKDLYEEFKRAKWDSFEQFLYERAVSGPEKYKNFRRILYEIFDQVELALDRYMDFEREYGTDEEYLYEIFMRLYEIYESEYGFPESAYDRKLTQEILNGDIGNEFGLLDAVAHGSTKVVKLLLERGVDPNIEDWDENPILGNASSDGYADIVALLLFYGADPNTKDSGGMTPLYRAVERGHLQTAEVLLRDPRIDVTVSKSFLGNLVTLAVKAKDYKLTQLLLDHGINPDAVTVFGNSPLHIASENGQLDLVTVLLSYDANRSLINDDGKTASQVARDNGYDDIANYINNYQKPTYTKRAKW